MLLVKPAKAEGKLPAVIVLHGTGGNKDGQKNWLTDLAKKGIIGVAIDARYHGERAGGAKGAKAYNEAIVRAWKTKPGEKHGASLLLRHLLGPVADRRLPASRGRTSTRHASA